MCCPNFASARREKRFCCQNERDLVNEYSYKEKWSLRAFTGNTQSMSCDARAALINGEAALLGNTHAH